MKNENSNLWIKYTVFPNGDVLNYSNGMPNIQLLQSNHPDVVAMQEKRIIKTLN